MVQYNGLLFILQECDDNDIDQPNCPIDGVAVGVQAGLTSPRSLASEKVRALSTVE